MTYHYSGALKSTENLLHDIIEEVLNDVLGSNWIDKCGVNPARVAKWKEQLDEERKRITGRGVDERLIYFSDFYDLSAILKKHWSLFSAIFGDEKTMDVYLSTLENYRNPDAHRRELFPHEISLIKGITGQMRTAVTYYRSSRSPEDEVFLRIEHVVDSLGNRTTPNAPFFSGNQILHPGYEVEY